MRDDETNDDAASSSSKTKKGGSDDAASSSSKTKKGGSDDAASSSSKTKKGGFFGRLFRSGGRNEEQICRLKKYDKELRMQHQNYRALWQKSKFTFHASDQQYMELPEQLKRIGLHDCAPIVEKRHMTRLVLMKERMRTYRKAGNALSRRIEEVAALIESCKKCASPMSLDDAFFVPPEKIISRRGSRHDAADFEANIQKRIDAFDDQLKDAEYHKRLQSPLSEEELTALLLKSIRMAGEAEERAAAGLKDILNDIASSERASLHWTCVTRCLWWESPHGVEAFKMASAALVDQRTVMGSLLVRLREKLEKSPPRHRSTVAYVMCYMTALVRARSNIDSCFPKEISKSVRLLQMMLEMQIIGPNLRRACFDMRNESSPEDAIFEQSIPGAFKAGPQGVGVPTKYLRRASNCDAADDDDDDDDQKSTATRRNEGNGKSGSVPFALAALLLERFGRSPTPADSAATLLLAVRAIYAEGALASERADNDDESGKPPSNQPFTAEDLLPALAWACVVAYVSGKSGFAVHRAIQYTGQCGGFDSAMRSHRPRSVHLSEVQYYLTSLQAAACSLERFASSSSSRANSEVRSEPAEEDSGDTGDATTKSNDDAGDAEHENDLPSNSTRDIDETLSSSSAPIPTPAEEWTSLHDWIEKEREKLKAIILLGDLGLVSLGGTAVA